MLVDAFLFNGECDLLEARFQELRNRVDLFCCVESEHTFSGQEKLIHREKATQIAKSCGVDLQYYLFSRSDLRDPWDRESAQRNAIINALGELPGETMVIVSDCDEIPRASSIPLSINHFDIAVFRQMFFYYGFNVKVKGSWFGPRLTTLRTLRFWRPQLIRGVDGIRINDGGWHCSFFGGVASISSKIKAYSHQEYNKPEYTDFANIQARIDSLTDLFDRKEIILTRIEGYRHCPLWVQHNLDKPTVKRLFV